MSTDWELFIAHDPIGDRPPAIEVLTPGLPAELRDADVCPFTLALDESLLFAALDISPAPMGRSANVFFLEGHSGVAGADVRGAVATMLDKGVQLVFVTAGRTFDASWDVKPSLVPREALWRRDLLDKYSYLGMEEPF